MTRPSDSREEIRKNALTAFLEARVGEGFRVETYTDTHAIILPADQVFFQNPCLSSKGVTWNVTSAVFGWAVELRLRVVRSGAAAVDVCWLVAAGAVGVRVSRERAVIRLAVVGAAR